MKNKENRLITEKSPYLLQHAHNPVDWHPWGKEAFAKALEENKPIFLSIGYSTCHWCHVMEKECFSDEEVAQLLNDACVSIKVDREERPDIDHVCMAVSLIMNGSGGWPLNLFLTPNGKPFFAASYIPKETSGRIPGLMDMVPRVKWLWLMQKEDVLTSAESIMNALEKGMANQKGTCPDRNSAKKAFQELSRNFDPLWGGFSKAPKFPMPPVLLFLLEYGKIFKEEKAIKMVEKTLDCMAVGGIRDHVGGGFARYSTDREWKIPHFEKMLYDQALLLKAYTAAWEMTGRDIYKKIAFEIAAYVLRDLRSPEGVFFAAEDADSEGVEGRFYVWTEEEIRRLVPSEDRQLFLQAYDIHGEGNVLALSASLEELAATYNIELQKLDQSLQKSRALLFEARNRRVRPHCDRKILTDWNALMIEALAFAGRIFEERQFIEAARIAVDFLLEKAVYQEKEVYHSVAGGKGHIPGLLNDYAFFIRALLELEEATGEEGYGEKGMRLLRSMNDIFYDPKRGGYFMNSGLDELLFFRPWSGEDGVMVSGNSVAMMNLLRFNKRTGNKEYYEMARGIGEAFAQSVQQVPAMYTHLLVATLALSDE
ncbi:MULTISPECIES: thioredoxin domain-containing protein [Aminobacterium]|jgi:uncharacterized protein YyaL (SSP411 family)|uniref:thioredoxin domain-containing protein n=1 Tax=Aminobacterium TaxID=81466 RepID=UPI000ACCE88B|nr:thioredoxin domain-containing protein [Aminobacterium sp. EBM-42]MDD2379475.1 thioredoxin domain-containing protein [Aminobacterium colombiense]MDD4265811.1 thioredoxin domain-containing protein [Aminobacterium colombiense]MDD4586412.1 thioredoxin domain-containing protein [Aminobacterium colombiense]